MVDRVRIPTEAECENTIIQTAKQFGWLVHGERPAYRQSGKFSNAIKGHVGWPDLVLMRPPQLLVIELKRPPNRTTPQQDRWLDAFRACGIDAEVIYVPDEMQQLCQMLATRP